MTTRQTEDVDGTVLSMLHAGDTGPTVLTLHGIPASAELWRGVVPLVAAAGYRVLAPDLPGYGRTRPSASADLSLVGIADLLARWLQARDEAPMHLVGHDIGGGIAQLLAVRHPQLIRSLTLSNCIVEDRWPVPALRPMQRLACTGLYPTAARFGLVASTTNRRALARTFVPPHRLPDDANLAVFWDDKVSSPQGRRAFARHLTSLAPDQLLAHSEALRTLPFPTQLIWAAHDRFQPWDPIGLRLAELLDDPRIDHLPSSGHFAPLEVPEDFSEALLPFLTFAASIPPIKAMS